LVNNKVAHNDKQQAKESSRQRKQQQPPALSVTVTLNAAELLRQIFPADYHSTFSKALFRPQNIKPHHETQ
jgi:hypothetical protein|tara:strand:+ start:820 stop:1032 length:213 start_codon:yes stop_codon:yes gene_type:complete